MLDIHRNVEDKDESDDKDSVDAEIDKGLSAIE
jgi:hypothetical protein